MDRHDAWNLNNADERDDEPFYCSAVHRPEDIIYAGSDTEESHEEVTKKRLRYEYHARRYKGGHLPVLQSASLRGPLTRESGWINPWGYRPRQNSDWWQPGSEDMLFTRENVMKRAVDHGLGYLQPAEALAWCKAAAKAEAEAIRSKDEQADILETIEMNAEKEDRQISEIVPPETQLFTKRRNHRTHSDLIHSQWKTEQSVTKSHNSDIGHINEVEDNPARGQKRDADSQWLRGSYISKRSKWDGPAVSSPTPDIQGERDRRQRQSSSRSAASGKGQPHSAAHFSAGVSQERFTMSHARGNTQNTAPVKESSNRKNHDMSNRSNPPSIPNNSNHGYQLDDLDELHDNSLVSVSMIKLQPSNAKSRRKSLDTADCSLSNLELDEFIAISPPDRQPETPAAIDCESSSRPLEPISNSLPTLPRHTQKSARKPEQSTSMEDDIFITAVAMSSRDLERFQYRKKRKILQPDACEHKSSGLEEVPQRLGSKTKTLDVQNRVDGEGSVSTTTAIIATTFDATAVCTTGKILSTQHSIPSTSKRSDASWDMMEDLAQYSSVNRPSKGSPGMHLAVGDTPHQILDSIKADESVSKDGWHLPLPRESTTVDGAITGSQNASQQPLSLVEAHVNESPDPNDVSTQSYNSTHSQVPKSTDGRSKSPSEAHFTLPKAESIPVQQDPGSPHKAVQAEMEDVQQVLSQSFPSITSENSTKNYLDHCPQDSLGADIGELGEENLLESGNGRGQVSEPDTRRIPEAKSLCAQDAESREQSSSEVDKGGEQTPGADSEVSWQGCGPQSPWMAVDAVAVPNGNGKKYHGDESFMLPDSEQEMPPPESKPAERDGLSEELGWTYLKRVTTPDVDRTQPFRNFRTPTLSPGRNALHVVNDNLPSTQLLVDATTNNPWTSNMKTASSAKSTKRVSFGLLPSKEQRGDSQPESFGHFKQSPGSPPPPQKVDRFREEDTFDDGTTEVDKFGRHFIAVGAFKHFLPEKINSPFKSSPAIGAMAGAFIEADQETSSEQDRRESPCNSPSRHLKPMSEAKANVRLQESRSDGLSLMDSFMISPNGKIKAVTTVMTDFEMEDNFDTVLGDVGDFLEDWSVDAELKKARESASSKDPESNGTKRRRLFGLI